MGRDTGGDQGKVVNIYNKIKTIIITRVSKQNTYNNH
jgi:hypothetical protein